VSFANTSYTDILATTIESRSKKIADNVTKNNALLARLKQKGKIRTFSGGSQIIEELSFAENGNAGWYSGFDLLPVSAQDVISAAAFSIKQCAVPVVISGLEQLQNAGREAMIDLMESRLGVAEGTMDNLVAQAIYSDGTTFGGKTLTGLGAAVVANPTTGTYGGIDSATFTFWQNQYTGALGAQNAGNIQANMNNLWAKCQRGKDRPDLIIADNAMWATYLQSLQVLQRFADTKQADLGFPTIKYMDADVVLDGGVGGFETANVMHFLNTSYIFFRPHSARNMVALSPKRRVAVNQDAEVEILAFAGNMTCSGRRFQGYFQGS
jgi:hypothetical protein